MNNLMKAGGESEQQAIAFVSSAVHVLGNKDGCPFGLRHVFFSSSSVN